MSATASASSSCSNNWRARLSIRGDTSAALELTRRQVARLPFSEEAHRRLIVRLVAAGDRAAAVQTYRTLATELRAHVTRAGALSAVSAALDLGGTAPLSLWAELIRELLPSLPAPGADASWPDDVAVLVSGLPAHFARPGAGAAAAGIPPDLQRTRLFEAVVALLGAWAPGAARK